MNINVVTITTECLEILILLFRRMVQESILLSPNYIEDAFEKLVAASEKRTEQLKSKNWQEEQEKWLYCALQLLMIHSKVKGQNANMTDFLQRFLSLNPRTNDGLPVCVIQFFTSSSICSTLSSVLAHLCFSRSTSPATFV